MRSTKTDQFARGRDVAIPHGSGAHCPVKALKHWLKTMLARHGCLPKPESPVFRSIDRYGTIRRALNPASIGWILTRRMQLAGVSATGYSAHSLRAGLITDAAKAGAPIWSIQRQTGHRSEQTVQRYIRDLGAFQCNAAKGLL